MGLLDDAIREHLDLKRRRGADPAEVERAEREALGPVRRNPAPSAAAEPDESAPPAGEYAYDPDDDREWVFGSAAGPSGVQPDDEWAGEEAGYEPLAADEPAPRHRPESLGAAGAPEDEIAPLSGWSAADEGELDPEPFPTSSGPADPSQPSGDETREFQVEADTGSGQEGEEDVLEETPEFLQDTPDHDRLWFEQRPPRDFDFDG